jgi:ribosome-associated toxin RatA of RatAB toxin-antitoxin module
VETVERSALVSYTSAEMFALVRDIESYPQFLPWCSGAEILSTEPDAVTARIDFAASGVVRSFTTCNRHQQDKMIEMHLVDGPFSHLQGCWQFDPLGDVGCKTSLFLRYEFSNRILGLVVGPVFSHIANSMVDAFHQQAVVVYGSR